MSTVPGTRIDVVVVAYRSAATLRACVAPLAALPHVRVHVVDNACPDDSTALVADLPVDIARAGRNGGFAFGCNLGAARGSAPLILLVNPDATLAPAGLDTLARALDEHPDAALAAPLIRNADGSIAWSQRRFPRLHSTWSQALFLHRIWPRSRWVDEVIRRSDEYARPGRPEWVSGACMLVRRSAWEQLGGMDERYFLYCEDTDFCRRLRDAGHDIRFIPEAEARHVGGHSSEPGDTLSLGARSRVLYAQLHGRPSTIALETAGIAVGCATHAAVAVRRPGHRRGHSAALRAVLRGPG
jgi:N-acetylglucosaminyl-diphospho-decaprenol L-rhamnosyltransferase